MLTEYDDVEVVEEPARPSRLGIVLVAILAVTMFGAAATLGVLYMNEKKAHAEHVAELTKKAKDDAAKLSAASDKLKSQVTRLQLCVQLLNMIGDGAVAVSPPPENAQLYC